MEWVPGNSDLDSPEQAGECANDPRGKIQNIKMQDLGKRYGATRKTIQPEAVKQHRQQSQTQGQQQGRERERHQGYQCTQGEKRYPQRHQKAGQFAERNLASFNGLQVGLAAPDFLPVHLIELLVLAQVDVTGS